MNELEVRGAESINQSIFFLEMEIIVAKVSSVAEIRNKLCGDSLHFMTPLINIK